jgi:hypothetical protein
MFDNDNSLPESAVKLAQWVCPSGNSCDVSYSVDQRGIVHTYFEWDDPPPLAPADERFYERVILPEVTRRVLDSLGKSGRRAAVITPDGALLDLFEVER